VVSSLEAQKPNCIFISYFAVRDRCPDHRNPARFNHPIYHDVPYSDFLNPPVT
jgi:hypothetical protein